MVERARLEIVYVSKEASRVRIPLSPPIYAKAPAVAKGYGGQVVGQACSSKLVALATRSRTIFNGLPINKLTLKNSV